MKIGLHPSVAVGTPLILALRRQGQAGLCECGLVCIGGQTGVHSGDLVSLKGEIPRLERQFVKCFLHRPKGPELGLYSHV